MESCPAKFWFQSYMNPNRPVDDNPRFDLGIAAHTALLEPKTMEQRIGIVDAPDWRTKAAQQRRDALRAAGKTPLLAHQAVAISAMRDAIFAHPTASKAWTTGKAEHSFVYRDALTEIWLKSRPDFVQDDFLRVVDYKTTTRAQKDAFARRVFDHGYFQQGAWNVDAVAAVTGVTPREFWLVAQEIEPPYLVSVYRLGHRALDWGRLLNRRAIQIFAECVAANHWPGYSDRAEELELPSFAEFQLEQRHEAGEFGGLMEATR